MVSSSEVTLAITFSSGSLTGPMHVATNEFLSPRLPKVKVRTMRKAFMPKGDFLWSVYFVHLSTYRIFILKKLKNIQELKLLCPL
jgi:hypothetical protein